MATSLLRMGRLGSSLKVMTKKYIMQWNECNTFTRNVFVLFFSPNTPRWGNTCIFKAMAVAGLWVKCYWLQACFMHGLQEYFHDLPATRVHICGYAASRRRYVRRLHFYPCCIIGEGTQYWKYLQNNIPCLLHPCMSPNYFGTLGL